MTLLMTRPRYPFRGIFTILAMFLSYFAVPVSGYAQEDTDIRAEEAPSIQDQEAGETAGNIPFDPSQIRIAVIDIQIILQESKAALSLREQLDEIRRAERDQIVQQEDALSDEQQELDRQRSIISPEAYEKRLRALEFKAASFNRELEGRKQQIDVAFESALGVIRTNLVAVVREIAQLSDVNIVFAKSQVLLVGAELDITGEALKRLDEKLPKVSLNVAASEQN